jgi:hypothetical protein
MGTITHNTVATGTNDGTKQVSKDAWNEGHAISLDKTDVGLDNVDNTSDASKPVSSATQTALDLKASQAAVDLKAPITSAVLVTPALGTIQSGNLAAGTGYTITNVAGMASNAGAFLVSATSASLLAMLTDETGAGANVFNTTASLIAPSADRYTVSAGNTFTVTASTYTAAAADNGRVGRFSVTCVVSINTGLPAGWWGAFRAITSAPLTITGSATVQSPNGRTTRAQWSELVVKYDASDVYVVSGDSKT